MGLLDGGVARVFSGIFGAFYPDAMLHRATRTEASGGSVTKTFTGLDASAGAGTMCKVQRDAADWQMKQAEGYAVGDMRFIILTHLDGVGLPEPVEGDRLTWPWPGGTLYSIEPGITLDAAASHWVARGRKVPA